MDNNATINKDLILREELALERTKMAQYRTILAFLRTALYFPVAGISMNEALHLSYGHYLQWAGIAIGAGILFTGLFYYHKTTKKIRNYFFSIGNYQFSGGKKA